MPDELSSLREAKAKLSDVLSGLQQLRTDAKELTQASKPTKTADDDGEEQRGGGDDDPFTRTMARFAEQANSEVAKLSIKIEEVELRTLQRSNGFVLSSRSRPLQAAVEGRGAARAEAA